MIDYYSRIYSKYDSSITYEDLVSYICGNMTVDQYKEYSKQEATIAKYKEAMKKEYNITDEELKKVYDENVSDYRTATVQKFFLSTMTTNENGESVAMADADKAVVKAKIDDYLAKFKSGDMVFEDTIKAASEETNAATSLGKSTINNNSLSGDTKVDEWALAKTAADAEGVYEVIESEKGYYIIRCNEVEDFDNSVDSEDGKKISIKNQIKQKIETERSDEQMRKEAEEAKGYELSDIKTDRIQDFLSEHETVATLVSQYGAKIGD